MKVTQTIKKNKTIRKVYDKYFAKSHRSIKRFINVHIKKQKEKEEKIIKEFINTITSTTKNSTPKESEETLRQKRNGISFIVLGRKECFSSSFMNSVKGYQEEGIEFIFCVDESIKDHAVNTALEEFREKQSTRVIYFKESDSTLYRLKTAVMLVQTSRVILFTMMDITNRRSLISYLKCTIKDSTKPVILHLFNKSNITKNEFLSEPSISALSGCVFETTFLSSVLSKICIDCNYFIPYVLFREMSGSDILTITGNRYWTVNKRTGTTLRELSYLCRDILNLNIFWSNQDADETKDVLYEFSKFVESYLGLVKKDKTLLNCFISIVVIFIAQFNDSLSKQDFRRILQDYSAIFYFDQLLKGESLHTTHFQIVEKLIQVRKNAIAVIEVEDLQELKDCLIPTLKEKYDVIYQTKPVYCDYHFLHCLVIRTLIQPAQYIVTSNNVHKFISLGKKTFTLWHGSGMLKKLAFYNKDRNPKDYMVTSSESCVLPWSEAYSVDKDKVLPFGQVQTDCMFDKEFEKEAREKVRSKYNIPKDCKVIFFAPTFRVSAPGLVPRVYYNLYMDIEKLSERFAEKGMYLITKRHHMFLNYLRDTGIDWSGVYTSKNKRFIVDDAFTFQELIVSADVFVTDYSSGIFYAVLRNMPVVLYAPDLDEYKNGPNGLMIKYPEEMAGVFVGEPNIDSFMKAIKDAETDVYSERYASFKEVHVDACDGHVKERVIKYLSTWDGNQFAPKNKFIDC